MAKTQKLKLTDKRPWFKPFQYQFCYDSWLKSEQSSWLHTEIPMLEDIKDWNNKLTEPEKHLLTQIFRLFTQSDLDVAGGYVENYLPYFPQPEVRMMLLSFAARETIHIAAYSHLVETIGFPETIYNEFYEYQEMKDKHDYFEELSEKDANSIAQQIAAFSAFTEGMQLFASFVILLNFPRHGKMKGMGQIITWSIVDEAVTPDTELLLENGDWKRIDEISLDNKILQYDMKTQESTFVNPDVIKKVQRNYTYEFIGENFNQQVSPNHRMIIEKNGEITEKTAEELNLIEIDANFITAATKIGSLNEMTEKQKELCILSSKGELSLDWVKDLYSVISSKWCEEFFVLFCKHFNT